MSQCLDPLQVTRAAAGLSPGLLCRGSTCGGSHSGLGDLGRGSC